MIIKTKLVPNGYAAIALYPFIFIRPEYAYYETIINHELIHHAQQRELWLVGFYWLYAYYYLKLRFKGWSHAAAYSCIPFEEEAYVNEIKPSYLKTRQRFAWRRFKAKHHL